MGSVGQDLVTAHYRSNRSAVRRTGEGPLPADEETSMARGTVRRPPDCHVLRGAQQLTAQNAANLHADPLGGSGRRDGK